MKFFDFVFIILTYKNTSDIVELADSIKIKYFRYTYKIIIVNSFYDNRSLIELSDFAKKHDFDFLNIENNGYSYGNNYGINYAKLNYNFNFLIIANPDTKIVKNDVDYKNFVGKTLVIAPMIKNLSGKKQNPYWAIKNRIAELLIYLGYKRKTIFLTYLGIIFNKIIRVIYNSVNFSNYIYAAHGSFIIFTKKALERIGLPYDEKMFLFAEESLLAHVLEEKSILIFYEKNIEILHKEDGSMLNSGFIELNELSKSIIYYYEKLKRK